MAENNTKNIKWQVPEYRVPERGKKWYTIAIILAIFLLITCFFSLENWKIVFLGYQSNFLFALIILISGSIMLANEKKPPKIVNIKLDEEGIKIGNRFYDYDEIKNFSIVYKPKASIKNLYFEFKNTFRPRLSIPLRSLDPLTVRNYLIKYLEEDLERTTPPLSEQLTNKLKL